MLDDKNVIQARDPEGALNIAVNQYEQTKHDIQLINPDHDNRHIDNIVIAGMGGSTLDALVLVAWLKNSLNIPIEVLRSYSLPNYVNNNTLLILSSYSGNTEETLSVLNQGLERQAQLAIVTSGGELQAKAEQYSITSVIMPGHIQPRMAAIFGLRSLTAILVHFGVLDIDYLEQIASTADWLQSESSNWASDNTIDKNYAKQLALIAVGKTAVFYGGEITSPVAYKWKISWNENAKNLAFWNQYPECNHNEMIGWTSHPVNKPYVIFDLVSQLEHPQILKRFTISDRILSGMRPKSNIIDIKGDTVIAQLLWSSILADFVSIYLAILNGVDPTPVNIVEKLKSEL